MGKYNYTKGVKQSWNLNNLDFGFMEKLQRYCEEVWTDFDFKNLDGKEYSHIFRKASGVRKMALEIDQFFTKEKKEFLVMY